MNDAKVIIIEKTLEDGQKLQNTLKKIGCFVVDSLLNSEKAVESIKKHNPDIVIMSTSFQGKMHDIEVARKVHIRFNIPVILLVDQLNDGTYIPIRDEDYFWVIVKPVSSQELQMNIDMILKKHKMEQDLKKKCFNLEACVLKQNQELVRIKQKLQGEMAERRIIDDAWKNSEEDYRRLVENVNSIIIKLDAKGYITFFNNYAERFFGYLSKEVIGQPCLGLIIPHTDSQGKSTEKIIQEIIAGDENAHINENIRKNGERVWVAWTNYRVRDRNGNVNEILSVGSDITNYKKNSDLLVKYRQMIEEVRDIILVTYDDGQIVDVNAAAVKAYGYSREEFLKLNINKLVCINNSNRESKENFIEPRLQAEETFRESIHCAKDGSAFLVEISITEISFNNKKTFINVIRDTTLRKRAELALKESETKFTTAFRASPDPLLITTLNEGRIVEFNTSFLNFFSYTAEEIYVHKFVETIKLWGNKHERDSFVEQVKKTKRVNNLEVCLYDKLGKKKVALLSSEIIKIDNDECLITIIKDIDDRKQMEEEIRNKNQELNSTLEKLQNTHIHMLQQEKLASIGQLAAGVAHEINNPLGFIISNFSSLKKYVNLLKEVIFAYREVKDFVSADSIDRLAAHIDFVRQLEKEKKISFILQDIVELFEETKEGLDRVSKIISELRSFSRVDYKNDFTEYDLNAGIQSALLLARNEIKYFSDVKQSLGNIPIIEAVGGYINQVLLNMILNAAQAIKAKNLGEMGLIEVTSYADAQSVYCVIKDNGIGIAQENVNKIFDPFFTTKPVGQGTGLGLSISYDIIVNKHHGEIMVDSTLGSGSVFTVKLPIRRNG